MKLKSVLLEILIVLFIAGSFYVTVTYEGGLGKGMDFIIGAASGALLAPYFIFWGAKRDLKLTEQPNAEKSIEIWQYIMLTISLGNLVLLVLYTNQTIESPKIMLTFYLLTMAIIGNFRANIIVVEDTLSAFFEDEIIQKKTKRFLGKIQFFGALITILLVLLLPLNYILYCIGTYFISLLLLPYLYARKLHKKKFA